MAKPQYCNNVNANPPVDNVPTILVHQRQEPPPVREGRMSAVTSVLLHSRLGCHGIFRPTFGTCHRFIPGFPLNFESSNSGLSLNPDSPDEMAFGQLRAPISVVRSSSYPGSGSQVLTDATRSEERRVGKECRCR